MESKGYKTRETVHWKIRIVNGIEVKLDLKEGGEISSKIALWRRGRKL